jgi:hypothetical protein
MLTLDDLYILPDFEITEERDGVACGHGALAAALERPLLTVLDALPEGAVNLPQMKLALLRCGRSHVHVQYGWMPDARETPSLVLLQFLGSWMQPEVHPAARCRYRHWVARCGDWIFDINAATWLPFTEWEEFLRINVLPHRATGYEVFRSLTWQSPAASLAA